MQHVKDWSNFNKNWRNNKNIFSLWFNIILELVLHGDGEVSRISKKCDRDQMESVSAVEVPNFATIPPLDWQWNISILLCNNIPGNMTEDFSLKVLAMGFWDWRWNWKDYCFEAVGPKNISTSHWVTKSLKWLKTKILTGWPKSKFIGYLESWNHLSKISNNYIENSAINL